MTTIKLPTHLNIHSADTLMRQIPDPLPDSVIFDFSALNFIEPQGVAYLGNLCEWLHWANKVQVSFLNHCLTKAPVKYLDDCGFFRRYLGKSLNPSASARGTTFPLMPVSHSNAHATIEMEIVPWLSRRMGYSVEALSGLSGVLSELFNNVSDHTAFDIGCLFAQDFPVKKRVLVAFSDFGCGIPENVRSQLPSLSDPECIEKSAEEGFTTGTVRNMGTGLFLTLQQVVSLNGGAVTIRSGSGSVTFVPAPANFGQINTGNSQIQPILSSAQGKCIGTMIELSLPTDKPTWFGGDEGEEGFEW